MKLYWFFKKVERVYAEDANSRKNSALRIFQDLEPYAKNFWDTEHDAVWEYAVQSGAGQGGGALSVKDYTKKKRKKRKPTQSKTAPAVSSKKVRKARVT